jgi:protein phosphatase
MPIEEKNGSASSAYVSLSISARTTVQKLLTHIYVLVPVLDGEKHYWVGDAEVEKLFRFGDEWLPRHPERDLITKRYLKRAPELARAALARLVELDDAFAGTPSEARVEREEALERPLRLQARRLAAVVEVIHAAGVKSVADVGCGEGDLVTELARDDRLQRIIGVDVSIRELERAKARLDRLQMKIGLRERIVFFQSSILYWDERLRGLDAIALLEVNEISVVRDPLYNDRRGEHGPFDIIGDVHGCREELVALLEKLGYVENRGTPGAWSHALGRRAVFLGDLVDRGPDIVGVLRLVMDMVTAGSALCVPGNHEIKLGRKLDGQDVKVSHGLEATLAQFGALPPAERDTFVPKVRAFIVDLVSHYWLDGGKLVVAHAGLRAEMHGRGSREVRDFALYGETTGETDEYGLPVRYNWASEYRGTAMVVYGHTPVPKAEWLNRTICVDTGCVYGGRLTALRYPELEVVDVRALQTYVEPVWPLAVPHIEATAQQLADDVLDFAEVSGKRRIVTRYGPVVTIPAENAAAAVEVMSRFCADPRWIIYLPPTMSPGETSKRENLLEHPDEAFAYYRRAGVARVVVEEKHMGSRAVVVVARDEEAARRRFNVAGARGIVMTRTGRAFFGGADAHLGDELLDRLSAALDAVSFWDRFETGWVCLDAELMPWSVKAQDLIDRQYAPVGEAASADLLASRAALELAIARGVEASELLSRTEERYSAVAAYARAYRRYVRPVRSVSDLKLAPFHLLATEAMVHTDRDHRWHMSELATICAADPRVLTATPFQIVELADERDVARAIARWQDLTDVGGEGVVVKPLDFCARDKRGLLQPALKVRGREYLRIVYGPEYTLSENMTRLRERSVASKRN